MSTALLPKTALATLAAVGLFLPFGAPLPGSCLRTIGVAEAAPTPSPSCGGDLRECLRASADMHQTTFGGRYVTADDVARCMEAFRSCVSGGASRGGNASPPKPTARAGDDKKGLPQRFGIKDERGISSDCRVEGDTVNCSLGWPTAPDYVDSWTGSVTGKANGLTVTGTGTYHVESHSLADSSCTGTEDYSGPVSYVFSPTGTVKIRVGPNQAQGTYYCNGKQNSNSWVTPGGAAESTGTWSPK